MDRRTFLGTTPAVAAVALAAPAEARAEVSSSGAFRLISEERFEYVPLRVHLLPQHLPHSSLADKPQPHCVHHYVVECPYPAESYAWLSIVAHKKGQVWVATDADERVTPITKPRRVIFPRVVEGSDGRLAGGNTVGERIVKVYEAVCKLGFDNVKPDETDWKVVWVEFCCSDGRWEHIIAGLPISWASELPLNVLVSQQIG